MPIAAVPQLFFENPVGRMFEHPDGFAIVVYNPGGRRFTDFKEFLHHFAELMRLRKWNRVLGDQRQMSRFTADEAAWIRDNWLNDNGERPTGLITAILLPRDDFASLAISQLMLESKVSAITYRYFDEEEQAAAEAWLREKASR